MRKKAGKNWIYAYYQGLKDGTYTAGRFVCLIYEYLVHGLEEKLFFFDAKKANHAIEWIEDHCFHTEGPLAPDQLRLEPWQRAMISAIFGITDKAGNRQFREIVLVVARKNGKSKLASSIAEYIWRSGAEGYGTRVFCLAPKLEQADIIYNDVWQMTQLDPEWQKLKELSQVKDTQHRKVNDDSMLARHRQTDLSIPGTNSTVKKIAFSAKKSDGFNPSLTICDEVASWQGDHGLKQYEVMKSAMGARPEGLMLSCTTSGYVNDSIYDELIKRSTRFLLGDSKERRLLPFLYMIDDVEKWNDINELHKSNPNLGVSVSVDYLLEEIAVAEGSLSKRTEFLTKYCCIKQASSLAWLDTATVGKCFGDPLRIEDFRGSYCVVGVDLSQTTDLSSCCVLIRKGGEDYVFSQFFLPGNKIDEAISRDGIPYRQYVDRGLLTLSGENFVDFRDCFRWILDLYEKYELYPQYIGLDRYCAQYLQQDLKTYGFLTDTIGQGFNLSPVLREMEGHMKDGTIHCGDNDLLKIHFLDAALKTDTELAKVRLIKLSPTAHIDGVAALSDAFAIRMFKREELGDRLENTE